MVKDGLWSVMVRVRVRIRCSVWLVSGYAHVFILHPLSLSPPHYDYCSIIRLLLVLFRPP